MPGKGIAHMPEWLYDRITAEPGWPALDEAEFAALLDALVTVHAPRLFALVQEHRERLDACITAWGMAFEHGAEVISVDSGQRLSLESAADAQHFFRARDGLHTHLVWLPAF